MLARYRMYRGARPLDDPLPSGIRMDTRRHTKHFLRPTAGLVDDYLRNPTEQTWDAFAEAYRQLLAERFAHDPTPFRKLADRAKSEDVFLGCSCPTRANPNVRRCHTVLALEFMKGKFSDLPVVFPEG